MPLRKNFFLAILAGLILTGCGGGGGGSGGGNGGTPPPQNRPPEFQSAPVDTTVPENTADFSVSLVATDPEGTPLTYTLEGEDRGALRFNSQTNTLSFAAIPDFEAPADANGDNRYVATLRATDAGGLSASLAISIRVTDVAESGDPVRYRDRVFDSVQVEDDVAFATADGQTLFLSIFTPAGDTATGRPVIIIAAGGGFLSQDRGSVARIAEDFALRGYVAATMDYRVSTRAPLNADELAIAAARATQDMFAAVRYFRADGEGANVRRIRPDAIFAGGESAGGVMAMTAATLDPADPVSRSTLEDFFESNGGVYGAVGDNDSQASGVQGALALSGAVLDLATVDAQSAPLYAAHEEFDAVVPCDTGPEGDSFTGLILSGACDVVPAYGAAGATAELYLVEGSVGHVDFTEQQVGEILDGAAQLFFETVISPNP